MKKKQQKSPVPIQLLKKAIADAQEDFQWINEGEITIKGLAWMIQGAAHEKPIYLSVGDIEAVLELLPVFADFYLKKK